MDPGVGHEVGLELGQVHVERAVEAQRRRDRGHDLPDQAVQVRVRRTVHVQRAPDGEE